MYRSFVPHNRTTADWINLGTIDGECYPLPARVFVPTFRQQNDRFRMDQSDLYSWHNAAVTDYDDKRKLWTVLTLDGRKREYLIPRIYIRFYAEDPRVFAKRILAAIEQRRIAEASIKLVAFYQKNISGHPAIAIISGFIF